MAHLVKFYLCANTVFNAQVTDLCRVRTPNSFLVNVMSTDGDVIRSVQHPVDTIHVPLHLNVDDCLIVRISAGNSAGMSSPTEITVGKLITNFHDRALQLLNHNRI